MEHKVNVQAPDVLIPPLLDLLEDIPRVPLVISGYSMTPFLVHGRDTVYLSKITQPPRRGDMILYRRDSGGYVLHRIYRAGATYTMVGDAQTLLEPGIRRDQLLARVGAVCRKGRLLEQGSFLWDFFERVWIRLVPLRPVLRCIYTILKVPTRKRK